MAVRTQQIDRTRQAIIDAATEMVFGTTVVEHITMQNIADAAGVSHRTLYRHFASRQELVETLAEIYDQRAAGMSVDVLRNDDVTLEDWVANIRGSLEFGALNRDSFRRHIGLAVASGEWRRSRDEGYWELFRRRFPNLPEEDARQDFAALRHLLSASNAILVGERFEMSVEEVAAALGRNAAALVAAIEERDQAAAQEGNHDHGE